MAISSDYPRPITVNGFVCRNCDDVSKAKKFENPAADKAGEVLPRGAERAVMFGGSLIDRSAMGGVPQSTVSKPLLDRFA